MLKRPKDHDKSRVVNNRLIEIDFDIIGCDAFSRDEAEHKIISEICNLKNKAG